jgi:hypothetical protein
MAIVVVTVGTESGESAGSWGATYDMRPCQSRGNVGGVESIESHGVVTKGRWLLRSTVLRQQRYTAAPIRVRGKISPSSQTHDCSLDNRDEMRQVVTLPLSRYYPAQSMILAARAREEYVADFKP